MSQYIFVLDSNVSTSTGILGCQFKNEWLEITVDGIVTITKGYAWDGCTPKFSCLDIVCGVPDGVLDPTTNKPKTYFASLFHDALYQYKGQHRVTRKQADDLFYAYLKNSNFKLRKLYYYGVRIFGGLLGSWK